MSNYYKNNKNIIWICSYLFPMYFERHFYTLSIKLFRIPLGNDLQLVSNMNWVHECYKIKSVCLLYLIKMDLVVSETNKGKKALLYEGFTYRIDFVLKWEDISWRCSKRGQNRCLTLLQRGSDSILRSFIMPVLLLYIKTISYIKSYFHLLVVCRGNRNYL